MKDSDTTANILEDDFEPVRIEHPFREFLRMYVRNGAAVAGFVVFAAVIFTAMIAPEIMKKDQMTSRERVLCAMRLEEPDKLPWIEEVVDRNAVFPLMGKKPTEVVEGSHDVRTAEEEKAISAFLGRDNITFNAMPPEFCDKTLGADGVYYYGNGHIRSEEDLDTAERN